MRRTGGGSADNLPELTPIDQRLVAVMGGLQFAAGDSHVAANPFPSTVSQFSYLGLISRFPFYMGLKHTVEMCV